jgi:hypothetical protein
MSEAFLSAIKRRMRSIVLIDTSQECQASKATPINGDSAGGLRAVVA